MIVNTTISGILAIILGYLIGSIPSAYIVTRIFTGKDIRTIGTGHTGVGNVGTRNVFINVGKIPGIIVAVMDIVKGVGAVFLAIWLVGAPTSFSSAQNVTAFYFYVLGAGLAAIIGHIWPIYLNFKGGAGLATSIGVLAIVMPRNLLFALIIAIVLIVVTRNVILSVNLGLITVPLWVWMFGGRWWAVIYPLIILVILFVHFLPNIVAEIRKAGSFDKLLAGLTRRDQPPKSKKQ
jgi:acyl phosphate:glycerol-3-phosphate acyltransferase